MRTFASEQMWQKQIGRDVRGSKWLLLVAFAWRRQSMPFIPINYSICKFIAHTITAMMCKQTMFCKLFFLVAFDCSHKAQMGCLYKQGKLMGAKNNDAI